jgi:thiamine biosynthesis lipoprotein
MMNKTTEKAFITKSFQALGTSNQLNIYGCQNEKIHDLIIKRVIEIDDRMSAFKAESDVSQLSRSAGHRFVKIHKDTFELLCRAEEISKLSGGAFDITVRPLVKLWGIGKKGDFVPSPSEIFELMKLVNYKDLLLDKKSFSAFLQNFGQAVDLGGIAKGYAADEAKRILTENGAKNAVINFGGNIVTLGAHPDGRPWEIGIQNPLAPTGVYLGSLSVVNKTVVTSGCNERFFIKDGVRYHHIIDPRTGGPAQSGLLSVTAVCSSSVDADALTTALFVLGAKEGLKLLNLLNAEAIFITDEFKIFVTDGLIKSFKPAENR